MCLQVPLLEVIEISLKILFSRASFLGGSETSDDGSIPSEKLVANGFNSHDDAAENRNWRPNKPNKQ
jgi:hypothetical protein